MIDRVLLLLQERRYSELRHLLDDLHVADIADLFSEIEDRELMLRLFRLLPKESAAETLSYMDTDIQQKIIEAITDVELKIILDDMFLDDCVDLIEEMPANVVQRVMRNSSPENRKLINQYLQYPDDSAGSLMTNEYVCLKRGMTVADALAVIRRDGVDKETIELCYVASPDRKLQGEVSLRQLVLSDPDTPITDIMDDNVQFVHTHDDEEIIAQMFTHYDLLAMPVVDNEDRLVGIITIDDAVDVIQEENTEDFELMAGMAPSEETYLKTPVFTLAKNRIVWLIVLMFSAMISGALLEHYEAAISSLPLLVSFIPMLMGTGGNGGSQASTIVIRGLALGEIDLGDVLTVWWKEARVALLCGTVLAAVNFLRIWLQYGEADVAAVVSLTLICTLFIAKSLGCLLPIAAKKLHMDPALMSAPLITTITDASTILVFFTFSLTFLADRL